MKDCIKLETLRLSSLEINVNYKKFEEKFKELSEKFEELNEKFKESSSLILEELRLSSLKTTRK